MKTEATASGLEARALVQRKFRIRSNVRLIT